MIDRARGPIPLRDGLNDGGAAIHQISRGIHAWPRTLEGVGLDPDQPFLGETDAGQGVDEGLIHALADGFNDQIRRQNMFAAGDGLRRPAAFGVGRSQLGADHAQAGQASGVVDVVQRRGEGDEKDAGADGGVALLGPGGHLGKGAAVDDRDRFGPGPLGRNGGINRRVAPAQNQHGAGDAASLLDFGQELQRAFDAGRGAAAAGEGDGPTESEGQQDGVKALLEKGVQVVGRAEFKLAAGDEAGVRVEQPFDLAPQERFRQTLPGDDAPGRAAPVGGPVQQSDLMAEGGQFGGGGQSGRAGADDGDPLAGGGDGRGGGVRPAFLEGLAADPALEMADGDGEGVMLIDAAALAEGLGGANVTTGRRQDIGFAQHLVGLAELLLGDEPDEFGDVDAGGTVADAGGVIALPAGLGHFEDGIEGLGAAFLVDRLVDRGVAGDAAAPAPIPHDLRAGTAGDTDFFGVKPTVGRQLTHAIRVGKGHAAQPHQGDPPLADVGGGEVGEELPQPGVAAPDHRHFWGGLLNLPHDADKAGDPLEGRFRRHRGAGRGQVEGTVDVGIEVRIPNGDVDQGRALRLQKTHQFLGFPQIRLGGIVLGDAEPIGKGHGVINVQPGGDDEVRNGLADLGHDIAEEPSAILEGTAIAAVRAGVRGVQLGDEIAVAGLHVHPIETSPVGALGGLDVFVLQAFEFVVADEGVVGRKLMRGVEEGGMMGDDRVGLTAGPAVAAGVGQLDNEQGPVKGPIRLARRVQGLVHQLGKGRGRFGVQPELARVGPALGNDRRGLHPEQAGSPAGEAPVTPEGQFVGRTFGGPVAPLHRQHHKTIGEGESAHPERLQERRQVVGQFQVEAKLSDFLAQLVGRGKMKVRWLTHTVRASWRPSAGLKARRLWPRAPAKGQEKPPPLRPACVLGRLVHLVTAEAGRDPRDGLGTATARWCDRSAAARWWRWCPDTESRRAGWAIRSVSSKSPRARWERTGAGSAAR